MLVEGEGEEKGGGEGKEEEVGEGGEKEEFRKRRWRKWTHSY